MTTKVAERSYEVQVDEKLGFGVEHVEDAHQQSLHLSYVS
jgi:hypothetical protein